MNPWLAIWAAVGLAHVPHQTMLALALPPDLDPAEPWFALSEGHSPMWLRSDDAGASWEIVGGAPDGDLPVDAVRLDDGSYAVLGESTLWWSPDGESWEREPLPGAVQRVLAVPEGLLLAGTGGAWAGPFGALEPETWRSFADISTGKRVVGLDSDGELLLRESGGWTPVAGAEDATALAADEHYVWIGRANGTVSWRDGDSWAACGALPEEGEEFGDVVLLSADADGVLWAANGLRGPYRSDNACQSWTDATIDLEIPYGGSGSPSDPQRAFVAMAADGDRVVIIGWPGAWASSDGGATWSSPPLFPPDYTRGLAVVGDAQGLPRVYVGSYGAGPLRTDDGGRSWSAANNNLDNPNVQELATSDENPDMVLTVTGHNGAISCDGGASWSDIQLGDPVADVSVIGTEAWAMPKTTGAARSTDCGASWADMPALAAGGQPVHGVMAVPQGRCAVVGERGFWCAEDPEGDWVMAWESDHTGLLLPVAWPPEAPSHLVFGVQTSLLRGPIGAAPSFGIAPTRVRDTDHDDIHALVMADDGSIFAGTRGGRVWRSLDGGESWSVLGFRTNAPIWDLAPRPGMATWGELLIGTLDGTFLVRESLGDATLSRFAPLQRLDNTSSFWTKDGCDGAVRSPDAAMDSLVALDPGCTLNARVRGERIRLIGRADGQGAAGLSIDGGDPLAIVATGEGGIQELLVAEMEDGWHDVAIAGLEAGVQLDALEAEGEGRFLASTPPEKATDPGCGCGYGLGVHAGWWVAALGGMFVRRRHP